METEQVQPRTKKETAVIASKVRDTKSMFVPNTCSNRLLYEYSVLLETGANVYFPKAPSAKALKDLSYSIGSDGKYSYVPKTEWRRRGKYRKYVLIAMLSSLVEEKFSTPFWCKTHKIDLDYILLNIGMVNKNYYYQLKDKETVTRDALMLGSDTKLLSMYNGILGLEKKIIDQLFTYFAVKKTCGVTESTIESYKDKIVSICEAGLKSGRLTEDEKHQVEAWIAYAAELSDLSTIRTASEFFVNRTEVLETISEKPMSKETLPPPLASVVKPGAATAVRAAMDVLRGGNQPDRAQILSGTINAMPPVKVDKKSDYMAAANVKFLETFPGLVDLVKSALSVTQKKKISHERMGEMLLRFWVYNPQTLMLEPTAGMIGRIPSIPRSLLASTDDELAALMPNEVPKVVQVSVDQVGPDGESLIRKPVKSLEKQLEEGGVGQITNPLEAAALSSDEKLLVDNLSAQSLGDLSEKYLPKALSNILEEQLRTGRLIPSHTFLAGIVAEGYVNGAVEAISGKKTAALKKKAAAVRVMLFRKYSEQVVGSEPYKKIMRRAIKYLQSCVMFISLSRLVDDTFSDAADKVCMLLQRAFASLASTDLECDDKGMSELLKKAEDYRLTSEGTIADFKLGIEEDNFSIASFKDGYIDRGEDDSKKNDPERGDGEMMIEDTEDAADAKKRVVIDRSNIKRCKLAELAAALETGSLEFAVIGDTLKALWSDKVVNVARTATDLKHSQSGKNFIKSIVAVILLPEFAEVEYCGLYERKLLGPHSFALLFLSWTSNILLRESTWQSYKDTHILLTPPTTATGINSLKAPVKLLADSLTHLDIDAMDTAFITHKSVQLAPDKARKLFSRKRNTPIRGIETIASTAIQLAKDLPREPEKEETYCKLFINFYRLIPKAVNLTKAQAAKFAVSEVDNSDLKKSDFMVDTIDGLRKVSTLLLHNFDYYPVAQLAGSMIPNTRTTPQKGKRK